MGMRFKVIDHRAPAPRPKVMILTCDSVMCEGPTMQTAEWFAGPGFITQYAAAVAAGWEEVKYPATSVFYCPYCTGKKKPAGNQARGVVVNLDGSSA